MKKIILIILIIVIVLSLGGVYLYYQNTALKVTDYTIQDRDIPEAFDGFTIAHISDLHNTRSDTLTGDVVKMLKKQKPDIIVFTGDTIDSTRTDVQAAIDFVARIKDVAPIYFVTGNHDVKHMDDYASLKEGLLQNGVILLENQAVTLTRGEHSINLLGIHDPKTIKDKHLTNKEKVQSLLSAISYNKRNYTVLLAHRPELLSTYAASNVDLVLTGHAHGGQIRIPFVGGVIAPGQGFFPKYTQGVHEKDDTKMVISRGIGNSGFPFRVNNRPELIFVHLHQNKGGGESLPV